MQAVFRRLKYWQLAHFSKPAADHPVYQAVHRHGIRSILEIGLGNASRAVRMIALAAQRRPARDVQYTGIDLFELASAGTSPGLSLKQAYRALQATGARVRLVPGDPYTALARKANELPPTQLVVISSGVDDESLSRAWFFLPRTLAPDAIVLQAKTSNGADGYRFDEVSREQLKQLSAPRGRRRAA